MGLYSVYGIEYAVQLENNKIIVIVPIKQADTRLLESEYYKTRKDYYKNNNYKSWRTEIESDEFKLTDSEKSLLDIIIKNNTNQVKHHGWYDVCYIDYLY